MVHQVLLVLRAQLVQLAVQDHWVVLDHEEFLDLKVTLVLLVLRVKEDKLAHQAQLDW